MRLDSSRFDYNTENSLIFDAVANYMSQLMEKGNIPHRMLDDLETDLREEATEIYRKITYGYQSIEDYRKSTERKKKARAS